MYYPTAPSGAGAPPSSVYPAGGSGHYPPAPGGPYSFQGNYYPGQVQQQQQQQPYGAYPPGANTGGYPPCPGGHGQFAGPPGSAPAFYPIVPEGHYGAPAGSYPQALGSYPPTPASAAGSYSAAPGQYASQARRLSGSHTPASMGSAPASVGSTPVHQANRLAPGPPTTGMPSSLVELTLACRNLLDLDTFSKSDPFCVLYIKEFNSQEWMEIGRTEVIMNDLNPNWSKKFTLEYRFEERQMLRFDIYDRDADSNLLSAHDFLGSLECSLGEIVVAPGKKFQRNLVLPGRHLKSKKSSQLIVVAEELSSCKERLHVKINGRKLDKKDFFGKSDPFVVISKQMDDGSWINVQKTEVIKNTLNPDWRPFSVRVASLTGGNPERKLKFECFDWNLSGVNDFIGEFQVVYADLLSAAKENRAVYPLINPKKLAKKKSYSNSGTLTFEWVKVEEEKTFLDYLQSGVQLHFTVAVDFTASNGDPSHPQSLHYRNSSFDNQYALAIRAVGEIIQDYDSDKLFPAMGFGAKVPPSNFVSHEFFLNGNPKNPFCQGVEGILEAYHKTLNQVTLYGPTYFAPVINHVARFAASYPDGRNYFVLLIITDGVICDLEATKEAIIRASHLPLSIIIVGVGQEDFSAMEFLDSDDRLLTHNGKTAARDIVQFVEMRKYLTYGTYDSFRSKGLLTRDVLAELPDQLVSWMRKLNPVA